MGTELFIINLAAALSLLFFIFLVVRAGLKAPLNKSFFHFLVALFSWLLLNYLSNQTLLEYELLLWINRLLFIAGVAAVGMMLRFCLTIRTEKFSKGLEMVIWALLAVASVVSLSPYVVESITEQGDVVGISFGWGSIVYFTIFAIFSMSVIVRLFLDTIRAKGIAKLRARALFSAFAVGLVLVAITNVILPVVFDLFYLSAAGSLVVVILLSGVGYTIVKYKLFDIRLIVARSLAYAFVITVLAIIYSGVTYGILSGLNNQPVSVTQELLYFLIAILLGLTFQPLKSFFDEITDKIFYRREYVAAEVLTKIGDVTANEIKLPHLSKDILEILYSSLKPEFVSLYIKAHHSQPERKFSIGTPFNEPGRKLLSSINSYSQKVFITEFVEESANAMRGQLNESNVAAVSRLETSRERIGYLLLGPKRSGRSYSTKDWEVIRNLSNELALAIQNSLRFEEIQSFNQTLQDKVDVATERLRTTNRKLRQLDATKDEFVSMASHQLRTPLTSVKGYLSMVLEGDAGKLNPTQEKLLKEAYTSSERMVRLIADFLNVSRLRTGKFVIERSMVNLASLINGEISQLTATAATRDITLHYIKPADFPTIQLDKSKIQQVVMNLIDNAIFYSHPGGEIFVELIKKQDEIIFRVRDQGIGVPAKEKKQLFTKFYRASNARRQRPDGTGIGLFMAQKIVVAHNGAIIFESTEGKGSTFGFRIPIQQPEEINSKRLG